MAKKNNAVKGIKGQKINANFDHGLVLPFLVNSVTIQHSRLQREKSKIFLSEASLWVEKGRKKHFFPSFSAPC